MSSRNQYLSSQEREAAIILYRCLQWGKQRVEQGEIGSEGILQGIRDRVGAEPMARLEYAEIVNEETLDRDTVVRNGSVLALAVWIGRTRLIDNAIL